MCVVQLFSSPNCSVCVRLKSKIHLFRVWLYIASSTKYLNYCLNGYCAMTTTTSIWGGWVKGGDGRAPKRHASDKASARKSCDAREDDAKKSTWGGAALCVPCWLHFNAYKVVHYAWETWNCMAKFNLLNAFKGAAVHLLPNVCIYNDDLYLFSLCTWIRRSSRAGRE